jgi:hypothetical protein
MIGAVWGFPTGARAQEIDLGATAVSDTVFEQSYHSGPTYQTVYDRDRLRTNWNQSLTYFRTSPRVAYSASGNLTTQDFISTVNQLTFGNLGAHIDGRLTRKWILSLDGQFDMNSTSDQTRDAGRRDNQIQMRTQYNLTPVKGMNLLGAAYAEFQQNHDRSTQEILTQAIPEIDPNSVDTLRVQQDSSYTSALESGLTGSGTWLMKPWLDMTGTVTASRRRPSEWSLVRDFVNPLDGSGGGYVVENVQERDEPGDNLAYSTQLNFRAIPRTRMGFGFKGTSINQSRFDQEFRDLEKISIDRSSLTGHLDYGPFYRSMLTIDGSLSRAQSDFALRHSSNSFVTTVQVQSTLAYSQPGTQAGVTFLASKAQNEQQVSQNGIVLNRMLLGNGSRRISRRLALDGLGSLNLQSSQYVDPRGDQDNLKSSATLGGGYLLAPACTTTVHFSVNRSRNVSIDARASSANNTQTAYQMNATMLFQPTPNFTIRQTYLLTAEYKIYDYVETQNYLNRVRRIDTDFVDTMFTFAFLRLTHSFSYRDNGGYFRRPGESGRVYRIGLETYEQTLAVTQGIQFARGVRGVVTQSLLNQRNYDLATGRSDLRNRFSFNGGFDVSRTLSNGAQLIGAVRYIGGYDEKLTPATLPREEDYWIAGLTFQKEF